MKKWICFLILVASVSHAQQKYTTLSQQNGTTSYYGIARVALDRTPSTNDLVWSVQQVVTDANGVFQSAKWGYGLVNGVTSYEIIKWSDIGSTNVIFK